MRRWMSERTRRRSRSISTQKATGRLPKLAPARKWRGAFFRSAALPERSQKRCRPTTCSSATRFTARPIATSAAPGSRRCSITSIRLLIERLDKKIGDERTFFVFADTVAARSFKQHNESHGWLGMRFQTEPRGEPSQIIIHVRMLDEANVDQQEALGMIGVNLIYGAFYRSSAGKTDRVAPRESRAAAHRRWT